MKMKTVIYIALLGLAFVSKAEVRPPADSTVNITRTFDRMAPPSADIPLWTREWGGVDTTVLNLYQDIMWFCHSSTNPKNGQCDTSSFPMNHGPTTVPLLFVEERSGVQVILNLSGYKEHYFFGDPGCSWSGRLKLASRINTSCGPGNLLPAGIALTMRIPAAELRKIPVGGKWKAELNLKLINEKDGGGADYKANIELNVIDPNHIDIYFPEFGNASPLVELDLRPRGAPDASAYAEDNTTLDMCLYDGYNANSTRYELLIKDEGDMVPGRADGSYSIFREGGERGPERDRIDYKISLQDPEAGGMKDVLNNQNIVWTKVNQNKIRPVRLPTITVPVLCVPTPLQLKVEKFAIRDKNAGHYRGKLTVIFTPTTPTVD